MIKVDVSDGQDVGIRFPCLMKSFESDAIVLFTSDSAGTVISKGKHPFSSEVGFYSKDWDDDMFTRFYGSITLSNGG